MSLIGTWSNTAKETAPKWLKLANEAIGGAIGALDHGDYVKAGELIRKAIGYKHEAVQAFPLVLVSDTGRHVDFDQI
jgi:hypothetical protein